MQIKPVQIICKRRETISGNKETNSNNIFRRKLYSHIIPHFFNWGMIDSFSSDFFFSKAIFNAFNDPRIGIKSPPIKNNKEHIIDRNPINEYYPNY